MHGAKEAHSPPLLPGSKSCAGEDLRQAGTWSLTCPGTAAGLRTAGAADVTAAAMWAALAPADSHQEEEQERPEDHQAHKNPLWKTRGERHILTGLHITVEGNISNTLPGESTGAKQVGEQQKWTSCWSRTLSSSVSMYKWHMTVRNGAMEMWSLPVTSLAG